MFSEAHNLRSFSPNDIKASTCDTAVNRIIWKLLASFGHQTGPAGRVIALPILSGFYYAYQSEVNAVELSKNLLKNLRALRGSKSQTEFSEELGLAKAAIQAIEAQRTAIRLDTLELICNSLSISPQEVLSDAAQPLELDLLSRCLERTFSAALPDIMGDRGNRHGLSSDLAPAWGHTKL